MTEEQQSRYLRVVENAKVYDNLWTSDEFQKYLDEQFEGPMNQMMTSVMNADPFKDLELIQRNIIRFQTLLTAYTGSFKIKLDAAAVARKELNNLRTGVG